ncbi:MAG: AAA family ATPase [Spirochaetes bacterium]|nr:AAA family ATPase [Spirochaetota bacterium]
MIIINGYDNVKEIYRGSRYLTYSGIESLTGRPVIIKYFPFENWTTSDIVQLTYEFEQARLIESDHVAAVYGSEKVRDQNWNGIMFFTENPPGISLRHYALQKKIQNRELLDIAIQIARGLDRIHSHNILYADINPGSIIINPETRIVKIRDFGFSSATACKAEEIYNPDVIMNNLPYISPEQTGRTNRKTDHRSDFYSLGMTLYEVLTGQPAFPSTDPLEILHAHMARQPQPPTAVKDDIPAVISKIIMKMIAKNAENRYQSARGLIADLEECMRQIKKSGRIETFSLGEQDIHDRFMIPQRIYGRKHEIDFLMSLFEEILKGPTRFLMVSGWGGIGKSTLIHELQRPVTRHRGYFASGKFQRMDRVRPFSAFIHAFRNLIRLILSESEERMQSWKSSFRDALGSNGKIITDMIPEAELIIGSQPPLPAAGPEESLNRFNLVMKKFIGVFAGEEHPLVLAMEDLQWADSASLSLLRILAADPGLSHILFIGSYRDDGITDGHPVGELIAGMKSSGVEYSTIMLEPLPLSDVTDIIIDTLDTEADACRDLVGLIYQKTGGNPFFLKQFLKRLHEDGILAHTGGEGWRWDLERIKRMQATDNVIELMIERISRMRNESREILKIAAIIGNRFSPEVLSEVCDRPVNDVIIDLNESIQNELIISSPPGYAFSHDRIHESVLSITPVGERRVLNYRIGKSLIRNQAVVEAPEKVFAIVDYFNQSLELVTDPEERREVVQMNMTAAARAKLTSAYASAVKYLDCAAALLPEKVWEKKYELAFTIYLEKAECQFLAGIIPGDESIFRSLLSHARTDADRSKIYSLLIVLRSHQNRVEEAIELGLKTLRTFNLKVPRNPWMPSLIARLYFTGKALKKKSLDELLSLPPIENRNILRLMDIMVKITVPAYCSNKIEDLRLILLLALNLINMTLRYGNSRYAPYAYVIYGAVLGNRFGDYARAYEYGRLGLALNEKFHDAEMKARIHHLFGATIACWKRPFNEYIEHFTTALQAGISTGDFLFTSQAIANILSHSTRKGKDINSLILIYETHLNFIKLTRFSMARDMFNIFYLLIHRLKGEPPDQARPVGGKIDEPALLERAGKNKYIRYLYYLTEMISSYMFGDAEKTIRLAAIMRHDVDKFLYAVIHISEYHLYFSLAIAGCFSRLSPKERRRYVPFLKKSVSLFRRWAESCPENFLHLYHLLQAELLLVRGNDMAALQCYGEALRQAQKNGYINHEGIICERLADFHIRYGNDISAKAHISQARSCYREWGADAKVADIELKRTAYLHEPTSAEAAAARYLNYASIVNSLQAISSEIITEDLLKKLMKIALENAGADRGYFITVDGPDASIVAETVMTDEVRTVVKTTPLNAKKDLLVPIVNFVMRSKKHLLIHDVRSEDSLPLEEYLTDSRPVSVLCLPVVRHTRLTGILYLENRILPGAFTSDHVEILGLLAAQAAISLEIAQLYDKLTQEITQHWKAEAALRDSEDRYRLVVESMNEGICVLNDLGELTFVNSRFCDMIGYDREEILGLPLEKLLTETSKAVLKQQLMRRRRGEHEPYEIDLERKYGLTISALVSPRPIFDADGNFAGSFGLFTDITERKRMEEDLLKASKIESLGVFAGGIAHDFNNLLTAIIGNISLARLNIPRDDQNFMILAEAENASLRAKDLTHQLLTFSKGGAPIKKTVSIKNLLRQTIDFALSGSNVVCIYSIQNDLRNAEIDEGQISQVIHNLVINAMQAMKEGGAIEVRAKNEVMDEWSRLPLKPGHYIRIQISDHGEGIPIENQKYIFDPYFTTKENGSGLGLTVSYSIIKRHGGHISFESEPRTGTTFIIYLPSSKEKISVSEARDQKSRLPAGRILIMDDDEVVLRVAGNMISHLGMKADYALHGEEAIEMYRKSINESNPYDLVIMDLTVPGKMGGKETIQRIRELNPHVKAIVSSGYSNDPVMANFSKYGFTDVVAKPYRIEDLKAVINRVMHSE